MESSGTMGNLIILNLLYGVTNSFDVYYCDRVEQTLESIVKYTNNLGKNTNVFIVNDDHQNDDNELNFMPPHNMTWSKNSTRLFDIERKLQKRFTYLTKNTFSAIKKDHNKELMIYNDDIHVLGFTTSFDLLSTCVDLSCESIKNIYVPQDCTSDLTLQNKANALSILTNFGVKVV